MTEFDRTPWLGRWENFELYFDDPSLQPVWALAEEAVKGEKKNFIVRGPFIHGARRFWQDACYTINEENRDRLGGWTVSPAGERDMRIVWHDTRKQMLADWVYSLDCIVENGLEKKPCAMLYAASAPEDCPFRYLLSMPPMPDRDAKNTGGLISHLHFQFSSDKGRLVTGDGQLKLPHWYATMCDADATYVQRRDILLVLHGLSGNTKAVDDKR